MNAPLDSNLLLPEQYSLVHSLSGTTLRTAANRAYLTLEKENIALRDWVDNLQCVITNLTCIYRFKSRIQDPIDCCPKRQTITCITH